MSNFMKSIIYSGVVLSVGLIAIFAISSNMSPEGSQFSAIEPAAGVQMGTAIPEGTAQGYMNYREISDTAAEASKQADTEMKMDASMEAAMDAVISATEQAAESTMEKASEAAEAVTDDMMPADPTHDEIEATAHDTLKSAMDTTADPATEAMEAMEATEPAAGAAMDAATEVMGEKAMEAMEPAAEEAMKTMEKTATEAMQ